MSFHNIRDYSDTDLLELVRDILAKAGPLTGIDKVELAEINHEFQRRDLIRLAAKLHPTLNAK